MTRQSQETALIRNITTQTKKGEHMQSFVDRFWAKETKAKQAKIDWKCSCCVACHIFIGRCDLPYDFVSKNQKEQSYKACTDLKRKAPFIKLNCEKILESVTTIESDKNENGIKTLSRQDSETRKVNQSQEIKLRHLIRKLYSENKLSQN